MKRRDVFLLLVVMVAGTVGCDMDLFPALSGGGGSGDDLKKVLLLENVTYTAGSHGQTVAGTIHNVDDAAHHLGTIRFIALRDKDPYYIGDGFARLNVTLAPDQRVGFSVFVNTKDRKVDRWEYILESQ